MRELEQDLPWPNQDVTPEECNLIRCLGDFDMTMFISEIHDHGWPVARKTLSMIPLLDLVEMAKI